MKQSILFWVAFATLSCSKSDSVPSSNKLLGSWKLISYCKPTGSSACTPVTIPADKGVFVSFDNVGQFNEYYQNTKPIDYSFLGCGSGYFNLEGDAIRIRAGCMSSSMGQLVKLILLTDNQLVLDPFTTGEYIFVRQ